uniref:EF-hand domain-containing protein n=2 Tax=Eptatretus burgeri TaxID=7764 RepID=A0A8C4QXJ6_EPTBU
MTEQLCCLASDLSALVNSSWAETRASEVKSRLVAATDLACSHLVRIHEDWQKAKTFQNAAQDHLVWCLDAEQALKALDISGDEGSFQNVSKQLTDWMQKLESQHFILAESESMAEDILHVCPPGGAAIILRWARIIRGRFDEVQACANGIQTRIAANRFALEKDTRRAEELMSWLASMQDMMAEEEIEPEKAEVTKECLARHQALVTEMTALQPEVDRLVRLYRRRGLSDPLSPISSSSTLSPSTPSTQPDFRSGTSPGNQVSNQSSPPVPMGCSSPQLQPLLTLWQRVWLAVLDRQGRLRETQNNPQEKKEDKKDNEDFFTTWGWRCLQWAGHRRLRVLDYFCRLDKDQDGLIHRQDFIQALLDSSQF